MTVDPQRTDPTAPKPQRWSHLLDRTSLLFRLGLMNGVFAAGIVAFYLLAHGALDLRLPAPDAPVPATAQQSAPGTKRLDDRLRGDQARVAADAARERTDRMIAWGAALIVGVGALLAWTIARSIRRSVRDVSAVARALAEGDLEVRYEKATGHEIGMIGASLNTMAQSLTQTLERMRADAERERFSKEVAEAFELAESERTLAAVAARAMRAVSSDLPMELLLADAGAAELTQVAVHPTAGSPGCRVHTPSSCVAVRRGSPVAYADSEQLNACPYLRGRHGAPLAATCVPLSFMGKSLGVLHTTSPSDVPFPEIVVANLETLAFAAATRTGTLRAFQRTQLQAMTDSLTGLLNRRALEIEMHDVIRRGGDFAVIVADLDHFKKLNDTLGHQSGDQALRRFGELLKAKSSRRGSRRALGRRGVRRAARGHAGAAGRRLDRPGARAPLGRARAERPAAVHCELRHRGLVDGERLRDVAAYCRFGAVHRKKSRPRSRLDRAAGVRAGARRGDGATEPSPRPATASLGHSRSHAADSLPAGRAVVRDPACRCRRSTVTLG